MTGADDAARLGDFYTFVAEDADTKLSISHLVGKRDGDTTWEFVSDLERRLANRVQISTDAFGPYANAIIATFGDKVDLSQVVKTYVATPSGRGRYSPPKVLRVETTAVWGDPDMDHVSTSYIERQNLTIRMHMRRFTRLTNGFSKKVENLRAAVALHFAWYNFCRPHQSLKGKTPAMAAGLTDKRWKVADSLGFTE